MRLSRARLLVVPAVLGIALLTGCGGSDAPSTTSDSTTAASTSDSAKAMDPCESISAEEVGAILGGTTTSAKGPSGQCEYSQEDARALAASISAATDVDGAGGIEGAKSGTTAVMDGDAEDVPGIGDAAFVVVGKVAGGSSDQAQGVVAVKGQLVTVYVSQASGLPAAKVHDTAVALLTLAAAKA